MNRAYLPLYRACALLVLLLMASASQAQRPIVIAHRGASAYLPEHTLPAVTAAHILGADFIEQDVVLSRDGVPVVLHDIYLDATTDVAQHYPERQRANGRFYAIDFMLTELKGLSVQERRDESGELAFPHRFPARDLGLRIPTLAEEIELIQGLNQTRSHQAGFYIELKAPDFHQRHGLDIAAAVLETLAHYDLNRADAKVYLQCFNDRTLERLRHEFKTPLPLIQLIADNSWGEDGGVDYEAMQTPSGLDRVSSYADGIGPWIPQLFEADGTTVSALVERARTRGLLLHPYTLRADALSLGADSFDELQQRLFLTAGVDGAFSDHADLTLAFLRRHFLSDASDTNSDTGVHSP